MKIILLGILKGIGVLLAALLLLLLLIISVVLLSPLRYRLAGEKKAAVGGSFGVSWLFGAVRIEGDYSPTENLRLKGRILWFAFGDGAKQKKSKKQKKQPRREKKQAEQPRTEKKQPDLQAAERRREEPKAAEPPKVQPQEQAEKQPKVSPQKMAERQPKTMRRIRLSEIEEKPPAEEELSFAEEMTAEEEFFSGTVATEQTERIPPILKKVWHLEDKKGIFRAFGKLLKRLIKGILPGDFFLKATLGTGDVVTTGYLLGLAGILTAKFGRDIQIKGDFTKVTAEDMEIRIKGKIILGRLLWAVLAFIGTKPVRRAIREMLQYLRQDTAEQKKGNGEAA